MSKVALKLLGCYDQVKSLLERISMLSFSFTPLITIHTLVIGSYPPFALGLKMLMNKTLGLVCVLSWGGRDHFMTKDEFDTLFDFNNEGLESSNTL